MAAIESDANGTLLHSGVVIAGNIDTSLIQNIQAHLHSPVVTQKVSRHSYLQWNSDCDAVVSFFETNIKSTLSILRGKPALQTRFIHFHEFQNRSNIVKPSVGEGKYTVMIVVKPGSGFPLLCEGSHIQGQEGSKPQVTSITEVPQEEGVVVIFDSNLARQDPAVKSDGGFCILVIY